MSARPKILICSIIVWAQKEVQDLLGPIADVIWMDSPDRASFLTDCKPGGKYDGIVGIYRENESAKNIGIYDKQIIDGLPQSLKWIAHNGAGYDPVDVRACKARGIFVSNTPGAVDDATATTALYLLLSTMRQYSFAERSLHQLQWKPSGINRNSHDITGKTLAILGLGGIGQRLADLVQSFPMRVIYHSRRKVANAPSYCEYFENVEEMLAQADVLSVHVPLRKETEGLVGEEWIRALKPGAIIINTARGKVIDEEALIRALEDGHLAAAGLDVFPNEPQVNPRLLTFPQVTLLPHMGTENQDSQKKMEIRALQNLRDFLLTGMGKDLVIEHQGLSKANQNSGQNLDLLANQSSKLAVIDSLLVNGEYELQRMRAEFQAHKLGTENEVLHLKALATRIRPEIESRLREGIRKQIRDTIRARVKEEVDRQIVSYVPIPLDKQLVDMKKRGKEVKIALANSEARTQNSTLNINSEYESLAPILTDSGDKSALYPADLGNLFSYDEESLRALLRSYGLEVEGDERSNVSEFLRFIGATGVCFDDKRFGTLQAAGTEVVTTLSSSSNPVAAGVGEILQVVLQAAAAPPPAKPIMISYNNRVMALGRRRMASLNGRVALTYLKSKFGLLNATRPVILNASFIGKEEEFVEIDMDAWEELVPHIDRLSLYMEP
ncbi:Putative 2-hydroxyacid dehydrogenase UNK4.10 [Leucoagaricus sp. SymC.cos]|nr:Putative 2-hydroxyacid dehydrogenase UNK4.10 [Leucoagaricus sp. SymC.cos]